MLKKSAINRRLRILQLLPHEKDGSRTVSEITQMLKEDGIHAEIRAVQRDMDELSCEFQINCYDTEKPFRWFWSSGENLAIPAMGQFTALTLQLAEEILKPLLPAQSLEYLKPNFTTARHVLDAVDKRRTRRWLKKIKIVPKSLHKISAPIKNGVYDTVTQALYDDKQLQVTYMAASNTTGKPRTYSIHPYALLHRDTTTELVGKIDKDDTIRHWPLHRMQTAKVLSIKSTTPKSFDLNKYIKSELAKPLSGDVIKFKAWIKKDGFAFNHVLETSLSTDQKIKYVDDGLIITATVNETAELKWWILGLGERIKVLEPRNLRDNIRDTVMKTAKLYR